MLYTIHSATAMKLSAILVLIAGTTILADTTDWAAPASSSCENEGTPIPYSPLTGWSSSSLANSGLPSLPTPSSEVASITASSAPAIPVYGSSERGTLSLIVTSNSSTEPQSVIETASSTSPTCTTSSPLSVTYSPTTKTSSVPVASTPPANATTPVKPAGSSPVAYTGAASVAQWASAAGLFALLGIFVI